MNRRCYLGNIRREPRSCRSSSGATGVDDASVIATESRKRARPGKTRNLNYWTGSFPSSKQKLTNSTKELRRLASAVKDDAAIAKRTEVLTANQQEISEHETRRREAWRSKRG